MADHWDDDLEPLPDSGHLTTLREAGDYIAKLPKREHDKREWQIAIGDLMRAAAGHGPCMQINKLQLQVKSRGPALDPTACRCGGAGEVSRLQSVKRGHCAPATLCRREPLRDSVAHGASRPSRWPSSAYLCLVRVEQPDRAQWRVAQCVRSAASAVHSACDAPVDMGGSASRLSGADRYLVRSGDVTSLHIATRERTTNVNSLKLLMRPIARTKRKPRPTARGRGSSWRGAWFGGPWPRRDSITAKRRRILKS